MGTEILVNYKNNSQSCIWVTWSMSCLSKEWHWGWTCHAEQKYRFGNSESTEKHLAPAEGNTIQADRASLYRECWQSKQ